MQSGEAIYSPEKNKIFLAVSWRHERFYQPISDTMVAVTDGDKESSLTTKHGVLNALGVLFVDQVSAIRRVHRGAIECQTYTKLYSAHLDHKLV